jgi:hypothetical protein
VSASIVFRYIVDVGLPGTFRRVWRWIISGLDPILTLAVLFVAGCGGSVASGPTAIRNVSIAGTPGNYTVTLTGIGFGNPGVDVSFPYLGDLPNFRIFDLAQVGDGEWGYAADSNVLAYVSWFDTQIQVSGFAGNPGDAITVTVRNTNSGQAAVWGGNVPPTSSGTPEITAVQFSGTGQNLQITILGVGFGGAPVPMPYTGDLDQFFFENQRTTCSGSSQFNAGWTFWGLMSPSAVTLNYESWSDTEIRISGFAGQYGQGCSTVGSGDPVVIGVFNGQATGHNGGQTAWGGALPAISVTP